jgi:hypothetical protein
MKTRKFLVLFSAVIAMVAILVSCNSVGIAKEPVKTTIEGPTIYIELQRIRTPEGLICVELDPNTQCVIDIKNCENFESIVTKKFTVKEFFEEVFKNNVRYVKTPGSPCNSFTADVPGNTYYYCSGGYCYAY